jgi:hypothetical protein
VAEVVGYLPHKGFGMYRICRTSAAVGLGLREVEYSTTGETSRGGKVNPRIRNKW